MYYKSFELTCIVNENAPSPAERINSADNAVEILKRNWTEIEAIEKFKIILLNNSREVLGIKTLSVGGVTKTIVDQRVVLKYISDTMASGAIIAHNHPSGNLEPSNDDTNLTGALSFLLQVAGAKLMDHIIMTKNQYFSFHENDRMPSFTVQEVNDHFRQILP